MKKLLCCLFATFLLAGCSGSGTVSKTCSMEQNGLEMKMIAETPSKNADVEKITLSVKGSYDDLGFTKEELETSGMKDMFLSAVEDGVFSSFDVEKGDGVEVKRNTFTNIGYELEATLDIDEIADAIGMDVEEEDLSLASFVKEMEKIGMDCK